MSFWSGVQYEEKCLAWMESNTVFEDILGRAGTADTSVRVDTSAKMRVKVFMAADGLGKDRFVEGFGWSLLFAVKLKGMMS